jgi:hypothetical protein
MKHVTKTLATLFLGGMVMLTACKKDAKTSEEEISQAVKDQIYSIGFGTNNIQKVDEGYLVEGDIILTQEYLNSNPTRLALRVGDEEQYQTTNLVTISGSKRVITVSLNRRIPSAYVAVLDEMILRYNSENLEIEFQKVQSGGEIEFVPAHGNYLASSGFPDSQGNPYPKVNVNTTAISQYSNNNFVDYAATIFAHEVGHCIGFRHTDYFNRQISCNGSPVNEGQSTVGAIQIPGTPGMTNVDKGSFMLSCIGAGQDRPFTNYDKIALDYLY